MEIVNYLCVEWSCHAVWMFITIQIRYGCDNQIDQIDNDKATSTTTITASTSERRTHMHATDETIKWKCALGLELERFEPCRSDVFSMRVERDSRYLCTQLFDIMTWTCSVRKSYLVRVCVRETVCVCVCRECSAGAWDYVVIGQWLIML